MKLATGAQFVEAAAVGVAGAAQIATIAKTQFNGGANSITQPNAFGGGGMNGDHIGSTQEHTYGH